MTADTPEPGFERHLRTSNRTLRLGLAAALIVGSLPACAPAKDRFPPYRYRLTVEVDTPQGVRRGSSVIEVHMMRASKQALFPQAVTTRIRGEAVAVDMPNGKTLFALLGSYRNYDWASWRLIEQTPAPAITKDNDQFAERFDAMLADRSVHVLPRFYIDNNGRPSKVSAYPVFVTFGNLLQPATVKEADPDTKSAAFGQNYKIVALTVQLTHDPVTARIRQILPWLSRFLEPALANFNYRTGDPKHPALANLLRSGNFVND